MLNKSNVIKHIHVLLPDTNKNININVDGKNVIITGGNGCGKTRFLKLLYEQVSAQIEQYEYKTYDQIKQEISNRQNWMQHTPPTDRNYFSWKQEIADYEKQLKKMRDIRIELADLNKYCIDFNERKSLLRYFGAVRENNISHSGTIDSLKTLKDEEISVSLSQDTSNKFERYLVSFYNYGSHLIARENDKVKGDKVDSWFYFLQKQFQYLFEDDSLKLNYDAEEQTFYILQDNKSPYRFNQLSSGYQSILSIYADLLMKVELKGITSDELSGVVFIDEIDAHLHVSLQRKIFSFFVNAFPNIQFIVTTHSPFVVQSVNDAIIYDLSTNEQLEDLSMYSYEAIVKGLLGVDTQSDILNKQLDKLALLINEDVINTDALQDVINKIQPYENQLDMRSRTFLLMGKNALLDAKDATEGE
ncbi:TPA: ATP-binding protein [Escherichia coli]|uniref:AAA family ATPase n=1 Tax=Escherichia coli TaxID=562 RepID=UPI000260A550|nr:AAA family ATPase [Escherichia coli]EFN8586657.1 ATP-binding protein [Escherichia coli O8:H21]EFO3119050.1 ATP-binding protein [Escherichia coli O8]EFA7732262.1 ATP-binding protein [Escherichia coli]EFD5471396.1 ATP-binding protein [Escherichia coli]EFT6960392.1 ATP-binding protein [Escherichia coli]